MELWRVLYEHCPTRRAVGLIVAVGLFLGISSLAHPCRAELVDRVVAVVNDDVILLSELDQALAPLLAKLQQEGYPEAQEQAILAKQRELMLKQLISEKLTDQLIRRYHISVGDDEVEATIARIKEVNKLSDEKLQRMLALDGLNYDAYRKQVKEQLLRTRLVNLEVKSKIVITDEEIRDYYEKHVKQYAGQVKYHLRHILLRLSDDATSAEKERLQQQLAAIAERLKAGEEFAHLADIYSEASTAQQGGDLGVIESGLLAPQILEALHGLKAGDITPVVDTEQGYQLFFVEQVISASGKSFEEAKAEIQEKLFAEIIESRYKTWLEELHQRAHIQIME